MFEKSLLLQAREHGDLRLAETSDWRFAARDMVVPVVFTEMADAAREYPLIFLKGKPRLFVLVGLESGSNAYVAEDGRWLATYIPAQLRAYPFRLVAVPEKPGEYAVAFDADAPQWMEPQGQPLFLPDGQPTEYLNVRTRLLKAIRVAEPATEAMVQAIRGAGLLRDGYVRVRKAGKEESQLAGLQIVDEKKLNALSHENFARLRDEGVLPLIYAHLLSMANLRQGTLAGKYPELAKSPGSEAGLSEKDLFAYYGDLAFRFDH